MCTPTLCVNLDDGVPAAGEAAASLRACVDRAEGRVGLLCACTREVRRCLADFNGARCGAGAGSPVDEAQAWCLRYTAVQRLGCSAALCRPPPHAADPAAVEAGAPPPAAMVCFVALLGAATMVYLASSYYTGAPAARLALSLDSRQKERRPARLRAVRS